MKNAPALRRGRKVRYFVCPDPRGPEAGVRNGTVFLLPSSASRSSLCPSCRLPCESPVKEKQRCPGRARESATMMHLNPEHGQRQHPRRDPQLRESSCHGALRDADTTCPPTRSFSIDGLTLFSPDLPESSQIQRVDGSRSTSITQASKYDRAPQDPSPTSGRGRLDKLRHHNVTYAARAGR